VLLLGSTLLGLAAQAPLQAPDPDPLMMALAEAFSVAEKQLAAGDLAAMIEPAETIRELSKEVARMQPRGNADGFRKHAAMLSDASLAVLEQARGGDRARASSTLEDLRNSCVQCHVKNRLPGEQEGMFPAVQNTVTGTEEIATTGGKAREDRSNVLVFLEGVEAPSERLAPWRTHRISQKQARFEPRVLPILRGEKVEFPNDDFIYHNVFSLSEIHPFDLGAYGPGKSGSVVFPRAGLVRVYCNIHPQMLSTIVVLENPFFALTDSEGRFVIPGVPDGKFELRTWHEYGGDQRLSLELSGAELFEVPLRIVEDKVTVEHRNKFGLPYRKGYR
jgi:plastocyanin